MQLRTQLLQETYTQYINPDLTPAAAKLAFQEREKKTAEEAARQQYRSNNSVTCQTTYCHTVDQPTLRRPPITLLIRSLVGLITKV